MTVDAHDFLSTVVPRLQRVDEVIRRSNRAKPDAGQRAV